MSAITAAREAGMAQTESVLEIRAKGLAFVLSFEGKPLDVFSDPKGGPSVFADDLAGVLGCRMEDVIPKPRIGESGQVVNEIVALNAVATKLVSLGPVGVRFGKWLKKVIRPSDLEISKKALRDGTMTWGLIPVKSASGQIMRLKREPMITELGQATLQKHIIDHPEQWSSRQPGALPLGKIH
jgi:hypothetical protein